MGEGAIVRDKLFRLLKATAISMGEDESDEAVKVSIF